jgi:hypothetical protein
MRPTRANEGSGAAMSAYSGYEWRNAVSQRPEHAAIALMPDRYVASIVLLKISTIRLLWTPHRVSNGIPIRQSRIGPHCVRCWKPACNTLRSVPTARVLPKKKGPPSSWTTPPLISPDRCVTRVRPGSPLRELLERATHGSPLHWFYLQPPPTQMGRIISLSSCERMWQCHAYRPGMSKKTLMRVTCPG